MPEKGNKKLKKKLKFWKGICKKKVYLPIRALSEFKLLWLPVGRTLGEVTVGNGAAAAV